VRNSNSNRRSSRDKGKGREEPLRSAGTENGERGKYGLGTKPELNTEKAEELCGLEEGQSRSLRLGPSTREDLGGT